MTIGHVSSIFLLPISTCQLLLVIFQLVYAFHTQHTTANFAVCYHKHIHNGQTFSQKNPSNTTKIKNKMVCHQKKNSLCHSGVSEFDTQTNSESPWNGYLSRLRQFLSTLPLLFISNMPPFPEQEQFIQKLNHHLDVVHSLYEHRNNTLAKLVFQPEEYARKQRLKWKTHVLCVPLRWFQQLSEYFDLARLRISPKAVYLPYAMQRDETLQYFEVAKLPPFYKKLGEFYIFVCFDSTESFQGFLKCTVMLVDDWQYIFINSAKAHNSARACC